MPLDPPMLMANSGESPPSPSPGPPTETHPEFFNKNMMKKIGIVVGALIVSGTIVGTVGSQKHHSLSSKHRDCQDS